MEQSYVGTTYVDAYDKQIAAMRIAEGVMGLCAKDDATRGILQSLTTEELRKLFTVVSGFVDRKLNHY